MKNSVRIRVLSLLILAIILTGVPCRADTEIFYGDINQDAAINASDALAALQHSVRLAVLTGEDWSRGDVNADGGLNASDALLILQRSVRLIVQFPAEQNGARRTAVSLPWNDSDALATATPYHEVTGLRTVGQQGGFYSGSMRMPLDAVMVYIDHAADVQAIQSWTKSGMRLAAMTAAFRDGDEYFEDYPDRYPAEVQTYADGKLGGTLMTENYVEYKWQIVQSICEAGVVAVVLEEPSVRKSIGYSAAFKDEWKAYYGEEWEDPASSPAARYKRSRLISYMMVRLVQTVGERIKQNYPDIAYYVATHSLYKDAPDFVSATAEFAALDCVDGVIGQTWSNTAWQQKPYGGTKVQRTFQSAYLGYGVSSAAATGKTFFALSDPLADGYTNVTDWTKFRTAWHDQLAAQLLHPGIDRFQPAIWMGRSFSNAPADYRTEQLTIMQVLRQIGGEASTLYSGTPGVALAASSTLSWQTVGQGEYAGNSPYSLLLPLLEKGIPVQTLSLDRLTDPSQLDSLRVIMLTLDSYKPQTQQALDLLIDWTRRGGVLLCVGVLNDYDQTPGTWWRELGTTPFSYLTGQFGLTDLTVDERLDMWDMTWTGETGFGRAFDGAIALADHIAVFRGSGFRPVLKMENDVIGFEADAGRGRLLVCGLPNGFFSSMDDRPEMARQLLAYALRNTDTPYLENGLLAVQRGNYVIAHALQPQTLTGQFIDLFNAKLPIVESVSLSTDQSVMLMDISALQQDDLPRLCITGGELTGEITETALETAYSVYGPEGSVSAARVICNGHTLKRAVILRGERELPCTYTVDKATDSILIQLTNSASIVQTVRLEWEP